VDEKTKMSNSLSYVAELVIKQIEQDETIKLSKVCLLFNLLKKSFNKTILNSSY